MHTVEHSEEFKNLVTKSINAINNQFVACMKLALIKSLELEHLSKCSNKQFSNYFVSIMEEATEHIAPNFYKNLILRNFWLMKNVRFTQFWCCHWFVTWGSMR